MTAVGNLTAAHLPYRTHPTNAISGSNSTGGKLWLPIWSGELSTLMTNLICLNLL